MMKVAILDDYSDTLRTLRCFAKLASFEVAVFNDHVQDVDALAERLRDVEALAPVVSGILDEKLSAILNRPSGA